MKDYTTQSMYEVEQTDRHNEGFQYHNNLREWEENENNINQEEVKNVDKYSYTTIKKYDIPTRQPPVHRQRKVRLSVKYNF